MLLQERHPVVAPRRRPRPLRRVRYTRAMRVSLHEARLEAALQILLDGGVETVLDLGCGSGALLARLAAEPRFTTIVGVDVSGTALLAAEQRLGDAGWPSDGRVSLLHTSFLEEDPRLLGFDAAVLLEAIEHIEPDRLSILERVVFGFCRAGQVLVTTPNREYNDLYGQPEQQRRHPDHRFEWDRARFQDWAGGVAARNGYDVSFAGIGWKHPVRGCSTQLAHFRRCAGPGGRSPQPPPPR
ncbi:MAG: methyltransferase [Myxococcota bacterium]|nr:methyltransferase [Myxococcota bacterium]